MKPHPEVIIFDVDGVLVDVRESFHRTVLATVRFFTGKRVTRGELHRWKNQPGFNDDWKLSTAWVRSLGGKFEYDEVKAKFVELYWGRDGKGNVAREKWLLPRASLRRLASRSELALFTGRIRKETDYTLDRCRVREYFRNVVTVEDVARPKPDPEGLLKILRGREPSESVYLGDNVDDAVAARAAGIPFLGVLPQSRAARRERSALLRRSGALAVLGDVRQLEAWLKRSQAAASARTSVLPRA
ncbi:MAG TPA: HAD-IA family hydrolase [Candidatus Acidoferrales bacterium]|nr:HAD-IA family hydrolase [Candidatus Acidoferrales bacterium]